MTCYACRHEFCWICGKTYTEDHYYFYNFRGCPAMIFTHNYCVILLFFFFAMVIAPFVAFALPIAFTCKGIGKVKMCNYCLKRINRMSEKESKKKKCFFFLLGLVYFLLSLLVLGFVLVLSFLSMTLLTVPMELLILYKIGNLIRFKCLKIV